MRMLGRFSDRLLRRVVPRAAASAAEECVWEIYCFVNIRCSTGSTRQKMRRRVCAHSIGPWSDYGCC